MVFAGQNNSNESINFICEEPDFKIMWTVKFKQTKLHGDQYSYKIEKIEANSYSGQNAVFGSFTVETIESNRKKSFFDSTYFPFEQNLSLKCFIDKGIPYCYHDISLPRGQKRFCFGNLRLPHGS